MKKTMFYIKKFGEKLSTVWKENFYNDLRKSSDCEFRIEFRVKQS